MKNNLTFQGIVKNITSEEIGKDKKYIKTSILVEEDEPQYPNSAVFDVFDKPELTNGIEINDTVLVTFNMKAKEYNGKYYGSNSIFKIEKINSEKIQSISESSKKNIFEDEEKNENPLPF